MIINYGFSLTGKSHISRELPCQDNHKIKKIDNGWYIAAIADGVGSAKNSQIGSKIAVDTIVTFCEEYMPWDYNIISIKSMLRTAYNYAFKKILRESQRAGEPIESYDTTLTTVIYDGHRIVYGHSGDGAIIGLNSFGSYIPITQPQKGIDNVSVLPLRAGYTQWKIDSYEEELAAVLLMTDGIADTFLPYLLKDSENNLNRVYVPLASFFADPIGFEKDEETIQHIKYFLSDDEKFNDSMFYSRIEKIYENRVQKNSNNIIEKLRKNNFPIKLIKDVQDDKTLVGLINTEIEVYSKESTFYEEPDWKKLQEEWNRKAYPHLYPETTKSEELPSVSTEIDQEITNSESEIIEKPEEISPISIDELNQELKSSEPEATEFEKILPVLTETTETNINQELESYESKTIKSEEIPLVSTDKLEQEVKNSTPEATKSYKFPFEKIDKSDSKIDPKTKSPESTKKDAKMKKHNHSKKEGFFEKLFIKKKNKK